MSAHTPGPWHAVNTSPKTRNMGVYTTNGCCIALVNIRLALTAERRESDARLIAAAPELLKALGAIIKSVEAQSAAINLPLVANARAAIAKATGVQA